MNATFTLRVPALRLFGSDSDIAAARSSNASRGDGTPDDVLQGLADAFNASNAVLAYTHGINSTNLPVVPDQPGWYNAFTERFSDAKRNALLWQNSISPRLTAIPQTIVDYGGLFNSQYDTIIASLDVLIANPGDAGVRRTLASTFTNMLRNVRGQKGLVTQFSADLHGFTELLQGDEAAMARAVDDAMRSIGEGRHRIEELREAVANLRRAVDQANTMITAGAITTGVSIFVGAVGGVLTAAFGPVGLLVVGLGVLGVVAGAATMIAGMVLVRKRQAEMDLKNAELDTAQRRVGALVVLNDILVGLIELSKKAQATLGAIAEAWSLLEQDIAAVVAELEKAEGSLAGDDYKAMRGAMEDAKREWDNLVDYAEKFTKVVVVVEAAEPVIIRAAA